MFSHLALSENGFLFDSQSGKTFSLNSTGGFLLRRLIKGEKSSRLSTLLSAAFDVKSMRATRDVEEFLLRLHDLQIINGEVDQ